MKKLILVLMFVIMIGFVCAEDIGYVVKTAPDQNIINLLEASGFSYDIIAESEIAESDFTDYRAILVDKGNFQDTWDQIPVNEMPSIILNLNHMDDWKWTSDGLSSTSPSRSSPISIFDVESVLIESVIYTGDKREFLVYLDNGLMTGEYKVDYIHKSKKASGVDIIVADGLVYRSLTQRYEVNRGGVVTKIEEDGLLRDGSKAGAKGVFIGIENTDLWNSNANIIFLNSLDWLLEEVVINNPPVFNGTIPNIEWEDGETKTLDLKQYFSDPDGDRLTFNIHSTSDNQGIIIERITNGVVFFSNIPGFSGRDWIIFNATDGEAFAISNNITLIVTAQVPRPRFVQVGNKAISEGELLEFNVIANDPDNNIVAYSSSALPAGASFENQKFSWIPNFTQSGTYNLNFSVVDADGNHDEMSVSIVVRNVEEPPEFNDASQCKVKDENIVINIREPDNNDDFGIGDKIGIELRLENEFDEDMDFDVEVHLYNLDEDESVDDDEDSIDINKRDSEDLEFELEVPEDAKNGDYAIYVFAEGEENRCNSEFIEVNVEREDDDLRIEKFDIVPVEQKVGGIVEFIVDVKNVGNDDQDAYIKITNSELGLDIESEEFEIEKFDDEDEATKRFFFTIPESMKEGEYIITAELFFSGESVSESKSLFVSEREIVVFDRGLINLGKTADGNIIFLDNREDVNQRESIRIEGYTVKRISFGDRYYSLVAELKDPLVKKLLIILNIVLAIGSFILLIALIVYLARG